MSRLCEAPAASVIVNAAVPVMATSVNAKTEMLGVKVAAVFAHVMTGDANDAP